MKFKTDYFRDNYQIFGSVIRKICYLGLIFSFIFGLQILAKIYTTDTFEENAVVENIQEGLLIISSVIFFIEAKFYISFRSILLLLASCCLLAACREQDKTLDVIIPVLHWKIGYFFPLAALFYAAKDIAQIKISLPKFLEFSSFYMMYSAVIIILPLAQFVGHGPFVRNVLGIQEIANIKQFFEEAAEAVGYFIVLLSAVEMFFDLRIKNRQK